MKRNFLVILNLLFAKNTKKSLIGVHLGVCSCHLESLAGFLQRDRSAESGACFCCPAA